VWPNVRYSMLLRVRAAQAGVFLDPYAKKSVQPAIHGEGHRLSAKPVGRGSGNNVAGPRPRPRSSHRSSGGLAKTQERFGNPSDSVSRSTGLTSGIENMSVDTIEAHLPNHRSFGTGTEVSTAKVDDTRAGER
jgi:hypothetical protein